MKLGGLTASRAGSCEDQLGRCLGLEGRPPLGGPQPSSTIALPPTSVFIDETSFQSAVLHNEGFLAFSLCSSEKGNLSSWSV